MRSENDRNGCGEIFLLAFDYDLHLGVEWLTLGHLETWTLGWALGHLDTWTLGHTWTHLATLGHTLGHTLRAPSPCAGTPDQPGVPLERPGSTGTAGITLVRQAYPCVPACGRPTSIRCSQNFADTRIFSHIFCDSRRCSKIFKTNSRFSHIFVDLRRFPWIHLELNGLHGISWIPMDC